MTSNNQPQEEQNEENFAEMFEQAYKEPSRMEPGQKVEAPIIKLTPEWALIEVGGKGEGYVAIAELKDSAGNLIVKEGDRIRAWFLHTEEGEMRFTTKIGTGPAAMAQLGDAFKNHIALAGTVSREMKGGFEVTINGVLRAFCPFSQMGIRREENKAEYIGKEFAFNIIEMDRRNIVLSRREMVEKERQEKAAALKETLHEGDRVRGTVTSIQKFGAFIDIGGVEGLLPVSEIAWSRTENVSDVLKSGQQVEVLVKKLDWDNQRISFSLKDTLQDPWETADANWPSGTYHTGTVTRLAPFGAFISLGEGVEGLLHVSRLGGDRRVNHPEEILKVGQTLEVRIESVDSRSRRISLIPAEISREQDETNATMSKYQGQGQAESEAPMMGSMGEQLKRQLEKKGKI